MAFSCGAQSPFKLKERSYLRNMLSRRQLQGFVGHRPTRTSKRYDTSIQPNPEQS
jgi:hypothetical protein